MGERTLICYSMDVKKVDEPTRELDTRLSSTLVLMLSRTPTTLKVQINGLVDYLVCFSVATLGRKSSRLPR